MFSNEEKRIFRVVVFAALLANPNNQDMAATGLLSLADEYVDTFFEYEKLLAEELH